MFNILLGMPPSFYEEESLWPYIATGIVGGFILGRMLSSGLHIKSAFGIIFWACVIPVITAFVVGYIGTEVMELPQRFLVFGNRPPKMNFAQQMTYCMAKTVLWYGIGYVVLSVTFAYSQFQKHKKVKKLKNA